MRKKIEAILRRSLKIETDEVKGDADLSELGLTSLMMIEIIVNIEDELCIVLDDDDLLLDHLNTLDKIEACIQKAIEKSGAV